jgi:hypothetical protein
MKQAISLVGTAMIGLSAFTWGSSARAQNAPTTTQYTQTYTQTTQTQTGEAPPWQGPMPAPSNAFELKLGTGYTQGFGNIAPGRGINSVAGAGIGFSLDLDYRATPLVSAGLEAQYQEFTTENNTGSRGLAGSIGATIHGAPDQRGDPWLRLGTGYRLLWDVNHTGPFGQLNTTNLFHGFDIVTAKVGYDFRPSPDVALAPVVGADLQTFVWENATPLSTAQLGTFIYAGLQGRFNAGGSTATHAALNGEPRNVASNAH